jgi:hypothetical protein
MPGHRLQSVWQADALSHRTGTAAKDPDAHRGVAWVTVPGKDEADVYAIWGPYEDLPPGRYTAVFRMKVDRRAGAPVAQLDVFNYWLAKEGKNGTLASAELRGSDFAAAGRFQEFQLDFEHGTTGKTEYRVRWLGEAALAVDRIVILRRE